MSSMSRASSLPHSHSTPLSTTQDGGGGGSTTPRSTLSSSTRGGHLPPTPLTPGGGKKGGKIIEVKIITLDDSANLFQVQVKALGRVLFDQVCKQLNLLEADYFGLEYQDDRQSRNWLDLEKPLHRQVGLSLVDPVLWFCVKFYTPDPSTQLEEEYTRFLFCLQIKRDLSHGLLHCNENTAALMASYIVQAECGDYVSEDYPDHTYLSSYKFVPNQTPDLERRIMENHKKHAGQSPAAADLNLLETARRCELYGVRLHPARDHESILLSLSVAHMGILVFQNYTKINTFSWAKIRKISFKRKRFLIKLHPEGYGYYKDIVEFLFDNRNDCKNFWKKCVENHGFFRCSAVKSTPRQRTRVLSRGSSFRYSGKTQKQIVEFVRENYVKRQTFQRSQSFRNSNTVLSPSHGLQVGGEPLLAAQPLLPITIDSPPSLAAGATPNPPRGEAHSLSYETWTHSSSGAKVYPALSRGGKTREAFDEIQPDTVATQNQNGGLATVLSTRTGVSAGQGRKVSTSTLAGVKTTTQANQNSPITSPPHQEAAIVDVHDTTTTNSDLSSLSSSIPAPPLGPPDIAPAPIPTSTHGGLQYGSLGSRSLSSQLNSSPPPYSKSNHILTNNNNNHVDAKPVDSAPKVVILTNGNSNSPRHNNNNNYENTRTGSDSGSLNRSLTGDSPLSNSNNRSSKRRHTADKSYFIIKELHMTERTFRKDLEVINLWFRDEVHKAEHSDVLVDSLDELFNLIDPLHDANCAFLRDIELRLSQWENKSQQCIGDVVLKHLNTLPYFKAYMDRHVRLLSDLDEAFHSNPKFQSMYTSFETAKVCFLPLSSFVLKPLHRLLQYHQILDKLIHYYNKDHPDYEDCSIAHQKLSHLIPSVTSLLRKSENLVQLCELDRDLAGSELRLSAERTLVRIGCLAKFSQRRGYQQRMFLLYSDLLVYGIRSGPGFRVHAQLPLLHLSLEERADTPLQYSFQLYCAQRVITVAATSQEDKDRWLTDLSHCVDRVKQKIDSQDDTQLKYFSLKSTNSMDDVMDMKSSNGDTLSHSPLSPQRSNTTLHVCWHRNTSVSLEDALVCAQNQLSGYLLRKFKNSNGWQKLFLVFTNFCLFFYKTFQDDCPLASLPLIGYSVSTPSPQDGIAKDFVFKLTFKNHVYFFRAESEYTFQRWMSVIQAATRHTLPAPPPPSSVGVRASGGEEEESQESCRL